MKLFILFIFSFVFLAESPPDQKLLDKCMQPTIMVVGDSGYGTGAIVRSTEMEKGEFLNFFLTCSHVIRPNEDYVIGVFRYENHSTVHHTQKFSCDFYAVNRGKDISIGAFLSSESMPVAEIDIDPKFFVGSPLTAFGCGASDYPRFEEGKVTSPQARKGMFDYAAVRSSLHVVPGDSGGPVFKNYKIVGIVNSVRNLHEHMLNHMSFFVPLTVLKEWDEENAGAFNFCWQDSQVPRLIYHKLKFKKEYSQE